MEYCSSPKRYLQTAAPSNGQVPVHGPWTYGHFCGAGGMGNPINGTDAACQQHDACYAQAGLSPGSKFQGPNAQLKGCNQNLCNAVRGARQSIINQAAARGTRNSREVSPVYLPGQESEIEADTDVVWLQWSGEYGPVSTSLVNTISFPDGSAYQLSYEPTPGNTANVTGRLASVTLPAGGVIQYAYSGGSNGIVCTRKKGRSFRVFCPLSNIR